VSSPRHGIAMINNPTAKVVRMSPQPHTGKARFKFRYLIVAAFLLWGGYVFWFVQRPMFERVDNERAVLTNQLSQAKVETTQLTEKINQLHTFSYIELLAEQKYHLIAPGEILFSTTPAGPPDKSVTGR
jgi:cell division protein FtsB